MIWKCTHKKCTMIFIGAKISWVIQTNMIHVDDLCPGMLTRKYILNKLLSLVSNMEIKSLSLLENTKPMFAGYVLFTEIFPQSIAWSKLATDM